MLRQSLSEFHWFAERGRGTSPHEASYEMLAISVCFFPAFSDVSKAPHALLASLQWDAGTAMLPEDGAESRGGTRDKGTQLAGGAGFKCLGCLYPSRELQRWLHMQTRLHLT